LLGLYELPEVYDASPTQPPTLEQQGQLQRRGQAQGQQMAQAILGQIQDPGQIDALMAQLGAQQ